MSGIKGIDELKNEQNENEVETGLEEWTGHMKAEIEEIELASNLFSDEFDIPGALLEHMADEVHQVWCEWMAYLFSKGVVLEDRGFKINPPEFARWRRQMQTPYTQLLENEIASETQHQTTTQQRSQKIPCQLVYAKARILCVCNLANLVLT